MLEMREELLNSGFILNFSDKRNDLQGNNLKRNFSLLLES